MSKRADIDRLGIHGGRVGVSNLVKLRTHLLRTRLLRKQIGTGGEHELSNGQLDNLRSAARHQARRLESARRAFLREFGNSGKAAGDWEPFRRESKVVALEYEGTTYVPSFQFDEKGRPRPAVARVIEILGEDTSDWGIALWFTGANDWLDGKRPVDLLEDDPKEVIQAAEHEAAELVF